MKRDVFILHHHLNPGGVTQVIKVQAECLLALGRKVTILSGSKEDQKQTSDWDCHRRLSFRSFSPLGYLDFLGPEPQQNLLDEHKKIVGFLKQVVPREAVLHVHNPTLGKNPLLALAIDDLAKEGFLVAKHIHDFAEDSRPELFANQHRIVEGGFGRSLAATLYSSAPNVFYILINERDKQNLKRMGLPNEVLGWLPNSPAVGSLEGNEAELGALRSELLAKLGMAPTKPLVVYPVRAIGRKNVGEFLLLASLFKDVANWGVSLAPKNPKEKPQYKRWTSFAEANGIPVHFDLGGQLPYEALMEAANACITTSVREGFGLVFLEAWRQQKPLFGRNLPNLTQSMKRQGFCFDELYDHLWAPSIDASTTQKAKNLYEALYRKRIEAYESMGYSIRCPDNFVREFDTKKTNDGCVDFPDLPIDLQMQVIQKVLFDSSYKALLLSKNPGLARVGRLQSIHTTDHRRLVEQNYSKERFASRLLSCYGSLERNAKQAKTSKQATTQKKPGRRAIEGLIESFLDLSSLYFV